MMLNPQWLRSFATLCELGSFTRTAERLDLTQAAVSQHIRQLEERLGTLLIRHPRALERTPAGDALLAYCHEIDHAALRLQHRLENPEDLAGMVRLICPGSIGLALHPTLLALQAGQPSLSFSLRFAPARDILAAVLDKQADAGIVTQAPDDPRLAVRSFAREALELVLPAGCQADRLADLVRIGFVDHPDGRDMASRLLARAFPGQGHVRDLPVRHFTNQIGLILEAVACGAGFTVIPRHARQAFRDQSALHVVQGLPAVVDHLLVIHRAEWPMPHRVRHVLAHLQARHGG